MTDFKTVEDLATIIVSTFVLAIFCYFLIRTVVDIYLCISEKVQERRLRKWRDENCDKRRFKCGEVVYYQRAKHFVVSSLLWSHTEDTKLVLRSINYHSEDIEVDSKQVKKVVRSFDE